MAPGGRCAALDRPVRRHRQCLDVRVLRRFGRDLRLRGAGHRGRRRIRSARARAGGRRRSHHPVERPDDPDQLQGGTGAPGRCTVVLKSSPEAPAEGYVVAEVAEAVGLPAGVINVVTADREVSELLVRHPGVDKITFTGSTAAGRRIASICGSG